MGGVVDGGVCVVLLKKKKKKIFNRNKNEKISKKN